MNTSIGTSTSANPDTAIKEAASKMVDSPKLLILLSPYEQLKEASEKVSAMYPNVPLIGTSATSYYGAEASDKRTVLIGFGQDAVAEAGIIRRLSDAPLLDVVAFEDKLSEFKGANGDTICLEYCTNDEERLVTTMNVALDHTNIPLIGGTIFGVPEGKPSYAMYNGVLYENACCYAIIKNKSGKIRTYSELIYKRLEGAKLHIATEVNLAKKELITLDGRPAANVYCEDAGVSQSEIAGNVLTNPLGRVIGDEVFIASPYEIGERGSLINYKRVNENDSISVMELMDYEKIGAETRDTIKSENPKISLVLSINCIYRHLLFQNRNYLTEFLGEMAKLGPHVGVVGGGEQYKKQHINQTLVCAVFE